MKLTSQQKMGAVLAGIVVVVLAVVMVLIVPKYAELGELQAQIDLADQQVAETQTLLKQLEQAKDRAASTQADILKISNAFPEGPDLPSLMIELQDVANSSGLEFTDITPDSKTPESTGPYMQVPIQITVMGEWDDVVDYLRGLNAMTRAIRVTHIKLIPEKDTTSQGGSAGSSGGTGRTRAGSPKLEADLDIVAFVMQPPAPTPGAKGTVPPVDAAAPVASPAH